MSDKPTEHARLADAFLSSTLQTPEEHKRLVQELADPEFRRELAREALTEGLLATLSQSAARRRKFVEAITFPPTPVQGNFFRLAAVAALVAALGLGAWYFASRKPELAKLPSASPSKPLVENGRQAPPLHKPELPEPPLPPADEKYHEALASYYLPDFQVENLPVLEALEKLGLTMIPTADIPRPAFQARKKVAKKELPSVTLRLHCLSVATLAQCVATQAACKIEPVGQGFCLVDDFLSTAETPDDFTPEAEFAVEILSRQNAEAEPLNFLPQIQSATSQAFQLEEKDGLPTLGGTKKGIKLLRLLAADLQAADPKIALSVGVYGDAKINPTTNEVEAGSRNDVKLNAKLGCWRVLPPVGKASKLIQEHLEKLSSEAESISQRYGEKHPRMVTQRALEKETRNRMEELSPRLLVLPTGDNRSYRFLFRENLSAPIEDLGVGKAPHTAVIDFPGEPGIVLSLQAAKAPKDLPYGIPVKDKPGFVCSPFAPDRGMVDVTGLPTGAKVECPYTQRHFRVP